MDDDTQDRWWTEGKCFGDPLTEWLSNSLPADEATRAVLAQAKCSGCPVFRECGLDVLRNKDIAVIRAGQALDDMMGPKLRSQYAKIREQIVLLEPPTEHDGEDPRHADWPRRCTDCARVMRPRGEDYDDWPHTIASHTRNLCNTCHNRRRRSNGPVRTSTCSEHPPVRGEGTREAGRA